MRLRILCLTLLIFFTIILSVVYVVRYNMRRGEVLVQKTKALITQVALSTGTIPVSVRPREKEAQQKFVIEINNEINEVYEEFSHKLIDMDAARDGLCDVMTSTISINATPAEIEHINKETHRKLNVIRWIIRRRMQGDVDLNLHPGGKL